MKTNTALHTTIAILATAMPFTTQAAPQVYDLSADWSDTQNPNGAWSYRGGESLLFNTLAPWTGSNSPGPVVSWNSSTPVITRSTDFWMYQDAVVYGLLEPGDLLVVGVGTNVLWTPPGNGTITISGSMWPASIVDDIGTYWALKLNGVLLTEGEILPPPPVIILNEGEYDPNDYSDESYDRTFPYDLSLGDGGPVALASIPVTAEDEVILYFGTFPIGLNYTITFTPEAVDPVTAIENLALAVVDMNLQNGIENSLDSKLDAALAALNDAVANNDGAATNTLQSFINTVEAQRGNKLTETQADQLIAAAQEIQDALLAP